MTTYQKHLSVLEPVMPRVEVKTVDKVFGKKFQFNSWQQNAIVVNGNYVAGLASDRYNLVRNEDVLIPMLDFLCENFGVKNIDIKAKENEGAYFVDFTVKSLAVGAGNDKSKLMYSFQSSYNTQVKTAISPKTLRLICTNGMYGFVTEEMLINVKHTKNAVNAGEINMPEILHGMQIIANRFPEVLENQKKLSEVSLLDVFKGQTYEEAFKEIVKGTMFPLKQIKEAIAIAQKEALQVGAKDLNLWLAYNGLNNILNHADIDTAERFKRDIDQKIITKVSNLVHA